MYKLMLGTCGWCPERWIRSRNQVSDVGDHVEPKTIKDILREKSTCRRRVLFRYEKKT